MEIYADSHRKIKLANDEAIYDQNKHFNIAFHFKRDVVQRVKVKPEFKPQNEMAAGLLTRSLGEVVFARLI